MDVQELLTHYGPTFRRAARRVSLCDDDAEDALQRAALILLAKAPSTDPRRLVPWMVVVTRREALAVRRSRERELLGSPPTGHDGWAGAVESIPSDRPGPSELYERTERVRDTAAALARLKPAEHRAIVLQAAGYSYAEICELCGWSYTKVNRCLAEGRERLRRIHSV